jgi:5-methylcytosine-specific restriction endonuclease McrA
MTDSKKYADRSERNCVKCGILFSGYRCKACQSKRKKEYIEKNRERVYEYNNEWAKANREKVNEWQTTWRKNNPEKFKSLSKRSRETRREIRKIECAEWRKRNTIRIKKWWQKYKQQHAERIKENRRKYERENPEKVKASKHTRRTRILGLDSKIDSDYVKFLKIVQGMRCNYCEQTMSDYQIDHIVPIARGGDNRNENLQLLCAPCNRQKGAKTDSEYREYLNAIHS